MKKSVFSVSGLVLLTLLLSGCVQQINSNDIQLSQTQDNKTETNTTKKTTSLLAPEEGHMKKLEDFEKISATTATISTSKGDIEVVLAPDKAPVTVASFLSLAKSKFYDGIIVHRVEPGFVIQAGDPLTKQAGNESRWGTGGPGYAIPDEFSSNFSFDSEGILAMAKTAAPNSGGSQFFITLGPATFLNGQYTYFGKVTKGMDVVKNITVGDTIKTITFK